MTARPSVREKKMAKQSRFLITAIKSSDLRCCGKVRKCLTRVKLF